MAATVAPSYEDILSFEDWIEGAFEEVFDGYSVLSASRQQQAANLTTPRVELQLTVDEQIDDPAHFSTVHTFGDDNDPIPFHEIYRGTMRIRIVTNRDRETSTGAHLAMVKKCRWLMSVWQKKINTLNLPYHAIHSVRLSGVAPAVDEEAGEDLTQMNYEIIFGVRSTAWPQV